ncbi:MAG: hypothetical protein WDO12_11615 [Pseudomonadota bacterium]
MYSPFPVLGFIFWFGLFGWFAITAWARYLSEQERQKTLRAFAERGTPLDKEMMERLFPTALWRQPQARRKSNEENAIRGLMIGGVVCVFAGFGLLGGAQLVGQIERDALYGMSAGGVISLCVGLGLLTASRMLARMQSRDRNPAADAGDEAR